MSTSKFFSILIVFFITAAGIGYLAYHSVSNITSKETAAVNAALSDNSPVQFEIADTQEKQVLGLSGRVSVPHNYGMLFVFPTDGNYGFWMKDMLVPIDMIWLSDTGQVIGINDSVSPSTYPSVFYPPQPVRYVLEMRAGEAKLQGWSTGSFIKIPLQD